MTRHSEQGGTQGSWKKRVGWNGSVQWLLIFAMLTPSLVLGRSTPLAEAAQPIAAAVSQNATSPNVTDRIDPRITQIAFHAPARRMRLIIQKLAKDQTVEDLAAKLGGTVLSDLPIINAFAAEMSANSAYQLAQSPAVRWISIDGQVHSSSLEFGDLSDTNDPPNTYLDTLGIPSVWEQGLDGQGVGVAIIDSGVARDTDFSNLAVNKGFALNSITPIDLYGHGTHIAGIVAGNGHDSDGKYQGIAPGTTLLGLKIANDLGLAFESDVVKAMQWTLDNKERYNIRVVNLSLNSGVESSYMNSPMDAAGEILWFSGIVVVASAGNSGGQDGYNTVTAPPANDPFFITVGASDERTTGSISDDMIAAYSASGLTSDGFVKPDIIAPGTGIYSVRAKLSPWGILYPDRLAYHGQYFRLSGTSMAAPMVVGVISLLLQDEPNLTPDQVKYRLTHATNRTLPGQVNGQTVNFPYLDGSATINSRSDQSANTGLQASQLLWSGDTPIDWSSVNWNSVNWNSVNWNSVNWNSVNWNSVNWNSAVLEPPTTTAGILPLGKGESWQTPAMPTTVPDIKANPQLDQQIDSFLFLPSVEN